MCFLGNGDNAATSAAKKKLIADNAKNMNPDGTLNVAKADADPNTQANTDSLYRTTLPDSKKAAFDAEVAARAPLDTNQVAPGPDLADKLLRKAGATSLLRQQTKQGRKSSFLAGAMGDVTAPLLTPKSTLGGY